MPAVFIGRFVNQVDEVLLADPFDVSASFEYGLLDRVNNLGLCF
jgi:hypothetical protein